LAKLSLGIATAHGPLLSTPPDQWWQRGEADRRGFFELFYKGKLYTFDELVKERADENIAELQLNPQVMAERHAACQAAIATLAETFEKSAPDLALVIGDDQHESFLDDNMPAFAVYYGDKIDNLPMSAEEQAKRAPGENLADWSHRPPEGATYEGAPELAMHLLKSLITDEFDVAYSKKLPAGRHGNHSISHAFGYVYRRVMNDEVVPNVPVYINTFYPPSQPTLKRCYDFGKALRRAVESYPGDQSVAVIASGGLTHFVVEEDVDKEFLDALLSEDEKRITSLPLELYNGGTSEARNWIATAGAMAGTGLHPQLIDYVPCYRTEGGTGNAMGFVQWV